MGARDAGSYEREAFHTAELYGNHSFGMKDISLTL